LQLIPVVLGAAVGFVEVLAEQRVAAIAAVSCVRAFIWATSRWMSYMATPIEYQPWESGTPAASV
jgi:hypothetical protein